jgi:hypothetical protein
MSRKTQSDAFGICRMIVDEECCLDAEPDSPARTAQHRVGLAIRDRIDCAQRNQDKPRLPPDITVTDTLEEMREVGVVEAFEEADYAVIYRIIEESGTTTEQELVNVPGEYCKEIANRLRATDSGEECPNFPDCHCLNHCIDGWKHPSPEDQPK